MSKVFRGKRVVKKVGQSYIVWFEESNRWVQMEEPAWFVYLNLSKGLDKDCVTGLLSGRYGLPEKEARRFTGEMTDQLELITEPVTPPEEFAPCSKKISELSFSPFATRYYSMNGKCAAFSYGSRLMEYYIHLPLAHLEVPEMKPDIIFELFEHDEGIILRNDAPGGNCFLFSDAGYLKRRVFIKLANFIYGKKESSWVSFVHASAVTDGKKVLLLSSASGSGKSTLAALLQKKGLYFMSDDIVPLDAETQRAHLFPAAISVKEGAFNAVSGLYDPKDDTDARYGGLPVRHIRHLRPRMPEGNSYAVLPVSNIIFVDFDPQADIEIDQLTVTEALSRFHEEAWVSHNPGHAQAFIDWFANLRFHTLRYGNTEKAIDAVFDIFR